MPPHALSVEAPLPITEIAWALDRDGFALWRAAVSTCTVNALIGLTDGVAQGRAGHRCLLGFRWCNELATRLAKALIDSRLLTPNSLPVQCTYFDKTLNQNWLVSAHQDLSLPLSQPVAGGMWRAWSHKEGQHFAQPPQSVLERCLALRLHLDPCADGDGALRIAPGSHRQGILITPTPHAREFETCPAQAGDALLMRPLALHASSKRTTAGRRRVLHFVFGPTELPGGAQWPDWIPTTP